MERKVPLQQDDLEKEFRPLNLTLRKRLKKEKVFVPWGKKERVLVFFILFLTSFISLFLGFYSRAWKVKSLPRIKPSFNLFGEKIYMLELEKDKSQYDLSTEEEIKAKVNNLDGVYGVYVKRLDDGSFYGINIDESFEAASLNKLAVMLAILKEVEEKRLNLDKKEVLREEDKNSGSGNLYKREAGTQVSYRELLTLMGKESDNTAFRMARRILGDQKILNVLEDFGIDASSLLLEGKTSPREIGDFFYKAYKTTLIREELKDLFFDSLTNTIYEDLIPKGIPGNIKVSHKYGSLLHVRNDAGIVFSQKPFVLVILSKGIVEKDAKEVIPQISRIVYEKESEK